MIKKKDKPRKEGATWKKGYCPWSETNWAWTYAENGDGTHYKCTCEPCKQPKDYPKEA